MGSLCLVSSMLPCAVKAQIEQVDRKPIEQALKKGFFINYAAQPSMQAMQDYGVCIFDLDARVDLKNARPAGHYALAYMSLVEVHPHASSYEKAKANGLLTGGGNEDWKSDYMDVTKPAWQDYILKTLAADALEKGYDGWFLDTADSIERLKATQPEQFEQARKAMIQLIQQLRLKYPQKIIVLNRGFFMLDEVADSLDALLAEGLFQSWHPGGRHYVPVASSDREWLLGHLSRANQKGLPIMIVDYVDPKNIQLMRKTAEQIHALGFIPFISTPDLVK